MRNTAAVSIFALILTVSAGASESTLDPGSLIIPTSDQALSLDDSDTYRLVDALLAGSVSVAWVPAVDGTTGGAFVVDAASASAAGSRIDAWLEAHPSVPAFRTVRPLASHGSARRCQSTAGAAAGSTRPGADPTPLWRFETRSPFGASDDLETDPSADASPLAARCPGKRGNSAVTLWMTGNATTDVDTYAFEACWANAGPSMAQNASLVLPLPTGVTFVRGSRGASASGGSVTLRLGSLRAGETGCASLIVSFAAEGTFTFDGSLGYRTGRLAGRSVADPSLVVRFGTVDLLRFAVTQIEPMAPGRTQIFSGASGGDTALDPARDLEVHAFQPGTSFPHEFADVAAGSSPLVFYELDGLPATTLRVSKSGGRVVVGY